MEPSIDEAVEDDVALLSSQPGVPEATAELIALCQTEAHHIAVIEVGNGSACCTNAQVVDRARLWPMVGYLDMVARERRVREVTVAVNLLDEARVLPRADGPFMSAASTPLFEEYVAETGRRPGALEHPALFALHPWTMIHGPAALLSLSSIPGLHADLRLPDPTIFADEPGDELFPSDRVPWQRKLATADWRGSTTGGKLTIDNWQRLPRVRLCLAARDSQRADCLLTNVIQAPRDQLPMLAGLLLRERVLCDQRDPFERNFDFRYLVDIEGNSYSQRLRPFLASDSIVLKTTPIWEEYFYRWLRAGEHFVEIGRDFVDLDERVAALEHDQDASREIAAAATDLAASTMSWSFALDYTAALLGRYRDLTAAPGSSSRDPLRSALRSRLRRSPPPPMRGGRIDRYRGFLGKRYPTLRYCLDHVRGSDGQTVVELGTARSFVGYPQPGWIVPDTRYWRPERPEVWDWSSGIFTLMAVQDLEDGDVKLHPVDISETALWTAQTIYGPVRRPDHLPPPAIERLPAVVRRPDRPALHGYGRVGRDGRPDPPRGRTYRRGARPDRAGRPHPHRRCGCGGHRRVEGEVLDPVPRGVRFRDGDDGVPGRSSRAGAGA